MQETKSLNWLKRLKEESWEAELLISAASIFVIFSSFALLNEMVNVLINYLPIKQYAFGLIISLFAYLALGVLGTFFAIHFALRTYWIGLVGLNSVFPDYSLEDSAYSEIYTKKMSEKLPKLINTIAALDEVCSVIFSAAFAFLIPSLNISIILTFFLWINNLSDNYLFSVTKPYLLPLSIVFIFVSSVFPTLANLKVFKKNERIQGLYYYSTVLLNKLLLGPFYRYVLQIWMIFASNFKRKKSIVVTIIMMVFIGFGFGVNQISYSHWDHFDNPHKYGDEGRLYPHHYKTNNATERFLLTPEIDSQVISKSTLELFVPLMKYETKQMDKACKLNEIDIHDMELAELQVEWKEQLDCYAHHVSVSIDNKTISADLIKIDHPVTDQFGLFAVINLATMENGPHHVKIIKNIPNEEDQITQIPFYFYPEKSG